MLHDNIFSGVMEIILSVRLKLHLWYSGKCVYNCVTRWNVVQLLAIIHISFLRMDGGSFGSENTLNESSQPIKNFK